MVSICLAACGTSSVGGPADQAALPMPLSAPSTKSPKVTDREAAKHLRKVATKNVAASKPGSSGYKIGPQDVLQVSVFNVAELSKTVQVSETGTMNYPLIGETEVTGKTARDLEQDLTRKLGAKYLQNPQVTVLIKQYNSQRVTIEGAVNKPGIYPLRGTITLLQLIATAQGMQDTADESVVVLRKTNGKQSVARFDLSQLREGRGADPKLFAGDVVVVNTSMTKQAFSSVLKALPLARVFVPF